MNISQSDSVLIEARGVSVTFHGQPVLDNVDLPLHGNEIVTLVGLNGAGKSTLVRVMLGLLAPDSGQVIRKPNLRIGYTPQQFRVDPTLPLTVSRFLRLANPVSITQVQSTLQEVGAGHVIDKQLSMLSGGELQRVVLARALLRDPELLVLDEPFAGVDLAGQSALYRLIGDLKRQRQCGVLLVSHDLHLVMAATDRVVCINQHVCCTGHPQVVTRNPAFINLFGKQLADTLAIYTHHHDHVHEPMAGHGGHDHLHDHGDRGQADSQEAKVKDGNV